MSYKNKRKMSLTEAKKKAQKKLGVLDMASHREGNQQLILFNGKRGGHRATYNKNTKEFWYV